jgi:hypothetical protein
MSWRLWAVAFVLVLTARPSAQGSDHRPTLDVVVDDRSTAGGTELGTARTRADYVFAGAGIRISWMTQGRPVDIADISRVHVQLVILDRPPAADVMAGHPAILGFAVPAANRVYVYYDRIQGMALSQRVQPGWFLGVVIAHELAHVLLPDLHHTPAGVMAATLGPDPRVLPIFTGQEARLMRARLGGESTFARLEHR